MKAMRFATRWILSAIAVLIGENTSKAKDERGRWDDKCVRLGNGRRLGSRGIVRMFEVNAASDSAYASCAVGSVENATVASGTKRGSEVDDFASVVG
jgi:hypothetical protein